MAFATATDPGLALGMDMDMVIAISTVLAPEESHIMTMPIVFHIEPLAKPRITHQGRFSKRAKKYYIWCEKMRYLALQQKFELKKKIEIEFHVKMPDGWSKEKKKLKENMPHMVRPDLDNLSKAFIDALKPENDSDVYSIKMKKVWGLKGQIIVLKNM